MGPRGPRILWRVEAGAGFSSVAVSHDRLYTLWDEGEAQFLVCLDASTGDEVWRRELAARLDRDLSDDFPEGVVLAFDFFEELRRRTMGGE